MQHRITLNEAAERLSLKDRRAAELWCVDKGVSIACERRSKFINTIEFEFAVERGIIDGLKKTYPNNYKEIYNSLKNDNIMEAYDLASLQNLTKIDYNNSTYKPQDEYSTRIFNKFAS